METKNEIWKDIEGYEGLYQVSNLGRVRSLDHMSVRNLNGKLYACPVKGKMLTLVKDSSGYLNARLWKDGMKAFWCIDLWLKHSSPTPTILKPSTTKTRTS